VERAGKNMKRKITVITLSAMLFALCFPAEAQEGKKIPWIGYLAGSGSAPNQAFVQGMRDLGYVEARTSLLSIGRLRVDVSDTPTSYRSWSA
jgi:hypothetical protein